MVVFLLLLKAIMGKINELNCLTHTDPSSNYLNAFIKFSKFIKSDKKYDMFHDSLHFFK